MWNWDYELPKNWHPKTDLEWEWYLLRKVNYGDYKGLTKKTLRKHLPRIKDKLDLGKKIMLENFLEDETN